MAETKPASRMVSGQFINIQRLHVAKLLTDEAGNTATYDTPVDLGKVLRSIDIKPSNSSADLYADGQSIDTASNTASYELTFDTTALPLEYMAYLLGHSCENGVMVANKDDVAFSMVMFVRKVRKTMEGNFTFLVVTDRDDLDKQIVKNFVRTEVIGKNEECQPKNGKQLREYLSGNKTIIFTMIHKFKYDKGKKYPVLSERNDIIVIVDEAHRTQYKNLAENMHTGLPNANYVAFTGTPLLGSKRLINQWFGNYVSEYNFAQSVEDGSTVPLFYSKPVPEVCLQNDFLDDDLVNIIEEENLNEEEQRLLENSSSRILEVIKRYDRLDKIAAHIAYHFPRQGFLGKGMVVSVDKYTAVVMYEKVQYYWAEEKKKLTQERNKAATKERREELTRIIDYMNKTEMAVVISEEAGEEEKFKAKNLDIQKHRDKMNYISPEGEDIEDRFKQAQYRAVEIDDMKAFIEKVLMQINEN